jgi:HAD superfamily hydrolase (TIGR01490 family)
MAIAFFDLDRTLLAKNSATAWVRSERRLGYLSLGQTLRALVWIMRYQLGAAHMEDVVRHAVSSIAGEREEEISRRTHAFYEAEIRDQYRPGATRALAMHRDAGDALVLLTSSSNYVSRHVTDELRLDGFIANSFVVDDAGRFTGEPTEPICFGEGKRVHAEAYAQAAGHRLEACAFYTDSISDLPVLEVVGRPVAVNPDPKLGRLARRRGWEIADWGRA